MDPAFSKRFELCGYTFVFLATEVQRHRGRKKILFSLRLAASVANFITAQVKKIGQKGDRESVVCNYTLLVRLVLDLSQT